MGVGPGAAGVKTLHPAYQADPTKPAASAAAAARDPDLNSDLPDSDIRLPGAPRRHHPLARLIPEELHQGLPDDPRHAPADGSPPPPAAQAGRGR